MLTLERPQQLAQTLVRLSSATPRAVAARARLSGVVSAVTATAADAWLSVRNGTPRASPAVLLRESSSTSGGNDDTPTNATAYECQTPYATLCAECALVDFYVGHLVGSVTQMVAYFAGSAASEPSFAHGYAAYAALAARLDNASAPAVVGDSPDNPVRWPWHDRNNWRAFGDATPNKLRFDDLAELVTATLDFLVGDTSNSSQVLLATLPLGGVDALDAARAAVGTAASLLPPPSFMTMLEDVSTRAIDTPRGLRATTKGQFARIVLSGARSALPTLRATVRSSKAALASARAAAAAATANASTPVAGAVASFTSFTEVGRAWIDFFWGGIKTCSWRDELTGAKKRFAVGEALLIMGAVSIGGGIVTALVLPGQTLAFLGGSAATLGAVVVFGSLFVTYTWSFGCFVALPLQLADDVVYFLANTLFTRCDWFFAGVINEATYTNDHCAACALFDDDAPAFTVPHCSRDVGFLDFGYNAAFSLAQLFPSAVEWFNTTTLPLLSDVAALDYVQTRLGAFAARNMSDPIVYAQVHSCNAVYTFAPHLAIDFALLFLIYLAWPLVKLVGGILVGLLAPAAMLIVFMVNAAGALSGLPVYAAHAQYAAFVNEKHLLHRQVRAPGGASTTAGRAVVRLARAVAAKARWAVAKYRRYRRIPSDDGGGGGADDSSIPMHMMV